MKKVLVILLLVLYSAATIGATINMHYCMNKFAGYSFTTIQKEKCPKCGMKNTGCCKDEKKQIKLNADQQKIDLKTSVQFQPIAIQCTLYTPIFLWHTKFIQQGWVCTHAPPLLAHINPQAFFATYLI